MFVERPALVRFVLVAKRSLNWVLKLLNGKVRNYKIHRKSDPVNLLDKRYVVLKMYVHMYVFQLAQLPLSVSNVLMAHVLSQSIFVFKIQETIEEVYLTIL